MFKHASIFKPMCQWAVIEKGILICTSRMGVACSIIYPYGAIWDFCMRGYTFNKIVDLYQVLTEDPHAKKSVVRCLEQWKSQGLLIEP